MGLGRTIRELGVKISLVYDNAAWKKVDKSLDTITGSLEKIGLGAAAAAGTIFGFAESTASNAKQLQLYEQTLGINSERLQELAYAAKTAANVNREELVGALEGVSKTLDDVRRGNLDAAFTFQRLGLSQDVLANRALRADQVMMIVADRLRQIQDPIARTAIATQIFGAAGANLLPLLMKGSAGIAALGKEARNLGVIIDGKTIAAQARFMDQLNRIWAVIKNIAFLIGGELIKVLGPLIVQFEKYVVQNRKLIATGIAEFIKGLGKTLKGLLDTAIKVAEAFKVWIEWMGGAESAGKKLLAIFIAWQTLKIAAAVIEIGSAFWSLGKAMFALSPAITAVASALTPILIELAPLIAVAAAFHDLWKILTTGDIKETWIGQLIEKIESMLSGVSFLKDMLTWRDQMEAKGMSAFKEFGSMLGFNSANTAGIPGAPNTNNSNVNNQFSTNVTVQVPPGTSATQAQGMVADGVNDGLHSMLRHTRNQAAGGDAY